MTKDKRVRAGEAASHALRLGCLVNNKVKMVLKNLHPHRLRKKLSLKVPTISIKNMSCPDLTKAGTLEERDHMQRAVSIGDSLAGSSDDISVHSSDLYDDEEDGDGHFSFIRERHPSISPENEGESEELLRKKYETELNNFHGTLLEAMISNRELAENVRYLHEEILHNESVNNTLNDSLSQSRLSLVQRRKKSTPAPQPPLTNSQPPSIMINNNLESTEKQTHRLSIAIGKGEEKPKEYDWLSEKLTSFQNWLIELKDDFAEYNDREVGDHPPEEDPGSFSIKYSKETLFRFAAVDGVLKDVAHEAAKIVLWKSPITTFLVFFVFLHSIWKEYLLTLILFGVVIGLTRNYMNMKGWFIGIPGSYENKHKIDEKKLGVADRLTIMMTLNMKVAKTFHLLSDAFDKGISLWVWRKPEITVKVYAAVLFLFLLSIFRPASEVIKIVATVIGVKIFLLEYVFFRFPRVRAKYDLAWVMWNELPTEPQLEEEIKQRRKELKSMKKRPENVKLQSQQSQQSNVSELSDNSVSGASISKHLGDIFGLPSYELVVPGWENGKRCTLINKDRSFTAAFKNGRLFLTESYLLFARYKTSHPKNMIIHMKDIAKIERAKPYSWLPGEGMSIVVTMKNNQVFTFGAIANRDEAFKSIVSVGASNGYDWVISNGDVCRTAL